jgi:DNA-binding beta-propeller fold protein YncE
MKIFCVLLLAAWALFGIPFRALAETSLRLSQTIPLPKVDGRIDHMAVDMVHNRLFVAALGNGSVEVIDLKAGNQIHSMSGLHEPQGIIYVPEFNRLFVASAGDGTVKIFDGTSFKLIRSIDFSNDADNLRYDATAQRVYVGYGDGALGVIAAANNTKLADIKLAGHPESFQLEQTGHRIFVNVAGANHVAVVDRTKGAVIATWAFESGRENFPMYLDEASHRLLVGLRNPARVLVLDTGSGKLVGNLPVAADTDDIFYDAAHQRIYVSCGQGFVDIFKKFGADHYKLIAEVPTAPGARTSLFVPKLNRLYVAVPHQGNQMAEVRAFEVQP